MSFTTPVLAMAERTRRPGKAGCGGKALIVSPLGDRIENS
jgi:hypothetical protein